MAKITDFYKIVSPQQPNVFVSDNQFIDQGFATSSNVTWYLRLIQGSATRLSRYNEYNAMDNDVEVARALDIIAEEITGRNTTTDLPIDLDIRTDNGQELDDTLVLTLRTALRHWTDIHGFNDNRLFKLSRNMVKYGDCFFRKKSNHKKWEWLPAGDIIGAVVNADDITKIVAYQVRSHSKAPHASTGVPNGTSFKPVDMQETEIVPADQLVVFSINDDMSDSAPFGESVLRTVYKSHKQKELLEDAIVIYRVQRAPERRVFYVDVGTMPNNRIKTYLETFKNEIRQKKIPSQNMMGQSTVDSIYNPHCLALDTRIPLLDGRTLPLYEIIDEFQSSKTLWAFSINPDTGETVPGIISWAGITRKCTEVIELTFENGNTLICTPDHKIPVSGKGFIQAADLQISDLLYQYIEDDRNKTIDPRAAITKITYLDEVMDVGTLTIDQEEKIHNYHTFAVAAGIYVKNSSLEDIFIAQKSDGVGSKVEVLPGGCLSLDTKIDLMGGNSKTLNELITDFNNGITNYTYSCDPVTGKIRPGLISWAGVTQKDVGVVSLTLTNNQTLICTPDHKFPVWGKGFVEAANLTYDDIIIGCNNHQYNEPAIYDHNAKIFVSSKFLAIEEFDSYHDVIYEEREILRLLPSDLSDILRYIKLIVEVTNNRDQLLTRLCNDIRLLDMLQLEYITKKELNRIIETLNIEVNESDISAEKLVIEQLIMLNIPMAYGDHRITLLLESLNLQYHYNFIVLYQAICDELIESNITIAHLDKISNELGYTNIEHLISISHIHGLQILDYTVLDQTMDVGTLTIDQEEKYHNYHTFSLSCGIFTKNSQLGEQSDLEYFSDKVLRGLRVPVSWMKPGQNNAIFNDGKVGAAYVEEQQFAKFVERLQVYIENILDEEFKKFLFACNINIDDTLYRLKLPKPSNYQKYQQADMDNALLSTAAQADSIPYLAKRFIMTRYLQLSEDDILTNEQLIKQEKGFILNKDKTLQQVYGMPVDGMGGMGGMGGGDSRTKMIGIWEFLQGLRHIMIICRH